MRSLEHTSISYETCQYDYEDLRIGCRKDCTHKPGYLLGFAYRTSQYDKYVNVRMTNPDVVEWENPMSAQDLRSQLPSPIGSPFKTKNFNKFFFGILITAIVIVGLILVFFVYGSGKHNQAHPGSSKRVPGLPLSERNGQAVRDFDAERCHDS